MEHRGLASKTLFTMTYRHQMSVTYNTMLTLAGILEFLLGLDLVLGCET